MNQKGFVSDLRLSYWKLILFDSFNLSDPFFHKCTLLSKVERIGYFNFKCHVEMQFWPIIKRCTNAIIISSYKY